jgi:hypothetical protein
MPYGLRPLTVELDFVDHRHVLETSDGVPEPAFYASARPESPGLADAAISPVGAYYERQLAESRVAGRGGAGVLPERVRPGGHPGAVGPRRAGPATGRMALTG